MKYSNLLRFVVNLWVFVKWKPKSSQLKELKTYILTIINICVYSYTQIYIYKYIFKNNIYHFFLLYSWYPINRLMVMEKNPIIALNSEQF